ncbi:MAG: hypothetical protein IPF78_04290 [Flavobacteriales bacterium]|nr:hypothetical protein [Flavobacteriales bacterium]
MVTVDDIRTPVAGNVVFDLWEQRRKWLDDEWVAMSSATRDENVADVVSNGDYIILHGHTELVTGSNPKVHYLSTLPGLINQQFDVLDQFIANGNTYFKVPKNSFEQNWYGGNITINTDPPYVTNTRAVPSVGSLLELVRSNSFVPYSGVTFNWPELTIAQVIANLRTALPGAKRGDAVDIATISEKDLTIPSAERLLELYDKNEEPSADSLANNKKNLTEAEWDEARNIVCRYSNREPHKIPPVYGGRKRQMLPLNLAPTNFGHPCVNRAMANFHQATI